MMIRYKKDILAELKKAGYSTYRLRQQKLIGENAIQALRHYRWITPDTIARASVLLGCKPADLVEYIPDQTDINAMASKGGGRLYES